MEATIHKFAGSLSVGDVALVYYAGHGLQIEGENFLVPTDFRVSAKSETRDQGYSLSTVLRELSEKGAGTQVVILDACRDNPFTGMRSLNAGWSSVQTSAGVFLAFGTAPGSTASDSSGAAHGLFTKSLLQFLPTGLGIDDMFERVRKDVIIQSSGRQVPWTASSLVGSFHLDPQIDAQATLGQTALPGNARGNALPSHRNQSARSVPLNRVAPGNLQEAQMLGDATSRVRALDFSGAASILENLVSFDPRSAVALRLLGIIYHLLGRGAQSREALNTAVEINPKDASAYAYLCLVDDAEGVSSEGDCREALFLRQDLPRGHLGLALSLGSNGQTTEAYTEATRQIAVYPNSAIGYRVRAEIDLALNRADLAQQDDAAARRLSKTAAK